MLEGTRHCGAVRVTIPRKPRTVTDCNCSICRRYGVLWAYYKAATVQMSAKQKDLRSYSWGRKHLRFIRCADCGCVICWQRRTPGPNARTGVNFRYFDLKDLESVRRVPLDGAAW